MSTRATARLSPRTHVPFKPYWDLLVKYLKPQRGRFALLGGLLLGGIGLQILNPQIMRYFIDAATADQASQSLATAALIFMAVALLQQAVSVGTTYLGRSVAWSATNGLRVDLARHCLNLDMSFHNQHTPGELIERIDGDVAQLADFFSRLILSVIGNLLLLGGILFVLWLEDWRLGAVLALFALVTLGSLNWSRKLAIPHQKALRAAHADLFGFLEERLAGTEDIRACGAVDFGLRGLYGLQHTILRGWLKTHRLQILVGFMADMLLTLGTALALLAGYLLFRQGSMTIGTVYLTVHYINLLGQPIRGLSYQVESLQNIGASVERLAELQRVESKIQGSPGIDGRSELAETLPPGPLSLSFENVSFAYVEGEPVLRDLSFRLEPGAVMGVLGRTGSGKTTLARLIFRLYDPSAGRIALGGVDVRAVRLSALRERVVMVTQDVQLFRASVRDNLTFFDERIPDETIIGILEELDLADWYRSLPDGLDTQLGASGQGLSAGEAQLLALARVFLRNPDLVILDEASSRLDPATERRIEQAIDKLLYAPRRTAIVIAHRLSTVQRADNLIVLEEGRVIEYGQRAHLAVDSTSRFYHLLRVGLEEARV